MLPTETASLRNLTLNLHYELDLGVSGWVTYLAVVLGVRYVLGEAIVTAPMRWALFASLFRRSPNAARVLFTLIRCPSCFGFWIGLACARLLPVEHHGAYALVSALLAMLLGRVWTVWLGATESPLDDVTERTLFPSLDDETKPQSPATEDDDGIEEATLEGKDEGGHDG